MGEFALCLPSIWQDDWTDKIHQRLSYFWSWRFAWSILNAWYGVSPTNFLVSLTKKVTWGPFLESRNNFPGPQNAFMFTIFAFKIKVSILLKRTQWKYRLMKQNWLVYEPGTVLPFNRFWFQNLPLDLKSYRDFREGGPWSVILYVCCS